MLQFIGGSALLLIPTQTLGRWIDYLMWHLISENPDNMIGRWLQHRSHHLSGHATLLVSLYMLSHGVIKLSLVFGLLKEKLWVFPFAFVGFGAILSVEMYHIFFHFFWGFCILMSFDIFVLTMAILEYRKLKAERARTT